MVATVARIRHRTEVEADRHQVSVFRLQAKTCRDIVTALEKVRDGNVDFFIQTGGFEQLKMYEDELERRVEMANNLEGMA